MGPVGGLPTMAEAAPETVTWLDQIFKSHERFEDTKKHQNSAIKEREEVYVQIWRRQGLVFIHFDIDWTPWDI